MTGDDFTLDHVTVGVTIGSNVLTPEQISEHIGVTANEVKRIGDPRGHTGKRWEHNTWRIFDRRQGAPDRSAHDLLPRCLDDFLKRLKPISIKLRKVAHTERVEYAEFFIHVTSQFVPGISLAPEAITLLADTGLSLDIDVVLYGSEEA